MPVDDVVMETVAQAIRSVPNGTRDAHRKRARAAISAYVGAVSSPDPVEGKLYPCAPVEGTNPGDAGEIDAVYALLDTHFTRADPEEPGGPPTWGRSSGYFDPTGGSGRPFGGNVDCSRVR